MANAQINVKDVPVDFDIKDLENPDELAKYIREPKNEGFYIEIEDEDLGVYDTVEEALVDGYTVQDIEEFKHTTVAGLLKSEAHGVKLNSIEGLPYFFSQLFDRIMLNLRTVKNGNCVLKEIENIVVSGSVAYLETDEQLKNRIQNEVRSKKKKQAQIDRQKEHALADLRQAGFELMPDGSMVKIDNKKKSKK